LLSADIVERDTSGRKNDNHYQPELNCDTTVAAIEKSDMGPSAHETTLEKAALAI
jgi:hypothetical protein